MELHGLYHDVDRLPYLLLIGDRARRHGLTLRFEEHTRRGNEERRSSRSRPAITR